MYCPHRPLVYGYSGSQTLAIQSRMGSRDGQLQTESHARLGLAVLFVSLRSREWVLVDKLTKTLNHSMIFRSMIYKIDPMTVYNS